MNNFRGALPYPMVPKYETNQLKLNLLILVLSPFFHSFIYSNAAFHCRMLPKQILQLLILPWKQTINKLPENLEKSWSLRKKLEVGIDEVNDYTSQKQKPTSAFSPDVFCNIVKTMTANEHFSYTFSFSISLSL